MLKYTNNTNISNINIVNINIECKTNRLFPEI